MLSHEQLDIPIDDAVWVNGYALPPAPPIRPFMAVSAVLKLIRNKEDTRQVFDAVAALSGKAGHRQFKRFTDTPYGKRVMDENIKLENVLSDRAWLQSLPAGSLGRAYLDFMVGENLTPEGLVASAAEAGLEFEADTQFPAYQRLFMHQSVLHDVFHVITGYGRDALGELCNLAFTLGQQPNSGFRLIIALGVIAQKLEQPSQPFLQAIDEGRRMGREASFVPGYDLVDLFPLPLSEARRKLNIIEPVVYKAIPQSVKDNLLKPKESQTQAEREAGATAGKVVV